MDFLAYKLFEYKYLRFYQSLNKGNHSDSSKCFSICEYSFIYQYELYAHTYKSTTK